MPSSQRASFSDRLLAWWDKHGRKDLPWQHPRTPYRVWVSEIMLQQTQVATVIPYFERWMERFPDLPALASAPLDDVLALWSGLGYYARARNLHRAAQRCVNRFRGNVPDSFENLTELPGIGRSTANAILSLAFDRSAAVVDGNVKRVLARHAAVAGWPVKSSVHKKLWEEAEARLPTDRGADYTQAVMDLGAMVCTRSNPGCEACPVAGDCRALSMGATDRLPEPRPRKDVPEREVHMLVLLDDQNRVLLQRRPPSGIWGGLWSLPEGDSCEDILGRLGVSAGNITTSALRDRNHRLTHLRLRIRSKIARVEESQIRGSSVLDEPDYAWFEEAEWQGTGLPGPVRDMLMGQAHHQQ